MLALVLAVAHELDAEVARDDAREGREGRTDRGLRLPGRPAGRRALDAGQRVQDDAHASGDRRVPAQTHALHVELLSEVELPPGARFVSCASHPLRRRKREVRAEDARLPRRPAEGGVLDGHALAAGGSCLRDEVRGQTRDRDLELERALASLRRDESDAEDVGSEVLGRPLGDSSA